MVEPTDAALEGAIDVRQYAALLRRRAGLIASFMIFAVAVAAAWSFTRPTLYTSTALILVKPITTDVFSGNPNQLISMGTEAAIAKSRVVSERASLLIDESPAPDPRRLQRSLVVNVGRDTLTLIIAFTDPDAERAQRGADAFATAYVDEKRAQATIVIDRRINALVEELVRLNNELADVNGQVVAAADGSIEEAQAEATRDSLIAQIAATESDIAERRNIDIDPGQVISPPLVPESPSSPDHPFDLALGVAMGLILGVVAAFVRDRFDDRVTTDDAVGRGLGVATIGLVPVAHRRRRHHGPLEVLREPDGPVADAFRRLALVLESSTRSRGLGTFLVTSPTELDEKSRTAANLAVILARSGRRVLLVDADMYQPALHTLFGVRDQRGLADVVADDQVPVHEHVHDVRGLSLLTSGADNAASRDVLQHTDVRRFLLNVRGQFDVVIIDAPPVLATADSLELRRVVDGALIVTRAWLTTASDLAQLREQAEAVGLPIVGAVVHTRVEERRDTYRRARRRKPTRPASPTMTARGDGDVPAASWPTTTSPSSGASGGR